ncbi:TetR/AcrR family transcriptional regulator [Bacillus solimangrovi]|uniref:TetR family transcriptional regulator n=1 Tax=Bacillus solimangrovi TaxID=1305675 RepID=A0A1E5LH21_9BACI|nr:TetR/AcrR family transcriptional regulator [Bacillus solimangrovi]OEH93375.1 TetR family transcriptional regulator [Bacillus solimangrovi]
MSPRKAVDQELTRDMIMDVARELFVHEGYQHVSMRKIAKQLDYSHGAIYYHFKNKAELFFALVQKDFALLDKELERILKQSISSQQKLKEVLLGFIRFGLNHQSQYEIMFMTKDEEVQNYLNEGPNRSYEKFAQSVYKLCDHNISVKEIWSVFLSIHGFVAHYCRSGQSYDEVQTLAESHVELLLRAL